MAALRGMEIDEVVEHYIDTRLSAFAPVSTAAAVRTILLVVPEPGVSVDELERMVAEAALRRGRAVEFDLSRRRAFLRPQASPALTAPLL